MRRACRKDFHWISGCIVLRKWRTGSVAFLVLALACGDNPGVGGMGGDVGAGGSGGIEPPREIAAVTIESEPLVGTRIGQRWALTATALDAVGESIPDVDFDWESSEASVAHVDAEGLVTAMRAGDAQITATAAGHSDSVNLTARSAVPSDVGEMYTTWFARSDDAPVAIVDGRLEVFAVYPGAAQPTTPWPYSGVERFQWAGDRLAILTDVVDGLGTLRVLDRHEEWTVLRVGDAMGFELAGDLIAELGAGGSLRVKEGTHGPWTSLASSGVEQYQLSDNRIAVLQDDGLFRVKDGIDGEWTELATTGVRTFELHGDRIAALFDEGDGELRVKDGIDGPWTILEVRVRKVALSGDRIGVLRKDGVARVKDGIDGEWTLLRNSYVEDIELAGDRIAILLEGNELRVKDGLEDPWTVLSTTVSLYVLQGDYVGIFTNEGELLFKAGLDDPWSRVATVGTVTQLLPIADVPVPPARTTTADGAGSQNPCAGLDGHTWGCPTGYNEAQRACVEDGPRCKPASEFADPVPYYGRFCGAERPADLDWDWANGPDGGPMDAFDALCLHHDHAASWYPEAEDGLFDACIMRYGVTFGRLTDDGTPIAPGTLDYDPLMDKMGHLRDALANDAWYASDCTPEQLEQFIEATGAKHGAVFP